MELSNPYAQKGDTRSQGPQGPKGDAGPKGATGLQGPQGNVGPKGDSGSDLTIVAGGNTDMHTTGVYTLSYDTSDCVALRIEMVLDNNAPAYNYTLVVSPRQNVVYHLRP